jgi:Ala-tRNA(Pro) deacylase
MDDDEMLVAVVPADRRVHLSRLRRELGGNPGLATEESLAGRFPDCAPGAVPPVGEAFGLRTIVDDELDSEPEIYMEAGDHEALIRMGHDDFARLMRDAEHSHFAVPLR